MVTSVDEVNAPRVRVPVARKWVKLPDEPEMGVVEMELPVITSAVAEPPERRPELTRPPTQLEPDMTRAVADPAVIETFDMTGAVACWNAMDLRVLLPSVKLDEPPFTARMAAVTVPDAVRFVTIASMVEPTAPVCRY